MIKNTLAFGRSLIIFLLISIFSFLNPSIAYANSITLPQINQINRQELINYCLSTYSGLKAGQCVSNVDSFIRIFSEAVQKPQNPYNIAAAGSLVYPAIGQLSPNFKPNIQSAMAISNAANYYNDYNVSPQLAVAGLTVSLAGDPSNLHEMASKAANLLFPKADQNQISNLVSSALSIIGQNIDSKPLKEALEQYGPIVYSLLQGDILKAIGASLPALASYFLKGYGNPSAVSNILPIPNLPDLSNLDSFASSVLSGALLDIPQFQDLLGKIGLPINQLQEQVSNMVANLKFGDLAQPMAPMIFDLIAASNKFAYTSVSGSTKEHQFKPVACLTKCPQAELVPFGSPISLHMAWVEGPSQWVEGGAGILGMKVPMEPTGQKPFPSTIPLKIVIEKLDEKGGSAQFGYRLQFCFQFLGCTAHILPLPGIPPIPTAFSTTVKEGDTILSTIQFAVGVSASKFDEKVLQELRRLFNNPQFNSNQKLGQTLSQLPSMGQQPNQPQNPQLPQPQNPQNPPLPQPQNQSSAVRDNFSQNFLNLYNQPLNCGLKNYSACKVARSLESTLKQQRIDLPRSTFLDPRQFGSLPTIFQKVNPQSLSNGDIFTIEGYNPTTGRKEVLHGMYHNGKFLVEQYNKPVLALSPNDLRSQGYKITGAYRVNENPTQPPVKQTITGIASWYGPGFHGRRTANGERFDQNALTAAHKTLPFGTRVRVTNLKNGQSVTVRINDRGPFVAGREIDLSRGAAAAIGLLGAGIGSVRIDVLD